MRSSGLTVIAGVAAALCFSSIFMSLLVGQFFFPLSTLPLFIVLFLFPTREIWLALAGSGATLAALGLAGVFGSGALIGILAAFVFTAALPAIFVGTIYTKPLAYDDDGEPAIFVPAEVPMISLCFLSLLLFYTVYAFSSSVTDQTMYGLFYAEAFKFAETLHAQIQELTPDAPVAALDTAALARSATLSLSGIMLFMFIMGQYANLMFAQWILRRLHMIDHPLPFMGNLYFPHHFLAFFAAAAGLYGYGIYAGWDDPTLFALTPLLVAFGLPLLVQGLSTLHRLFVKRLVKAGLISVYLGLFLGMIFMPMPLCMILLITGIANNALVYFRNKAE